MKLVRGIPHQLHELLRMRHRKRAQHDGVEQAEDRSVGADAECQRYDDNRAETGIAADHARAVMQVAVDVFQHAFPTRVARVVFHRFGAAQVRLRQAHCLFTATARSHFLLCRRFHVLPKFFVKLPLIAPLKEQRAHTAQ